MAHRSNDCQSKSTKYMRFMWIYECTQKYPIHIKKISDYMEEYIVVCSCVTPWVYVMSVCKYATPFYRNM